MTNDDANMAVIFWFFIGLVMVFLTWMLVGGIMEKGVDVHNNITQSGAVPLSTGRQETLTMLTDTMGVILVIAMFLMVFVAYLAAQEQKNRQV